MANWMIPCNLYNYNVIDAIKELEVIDWKQTTNINVNDNVFIYVGKPISAIVCKCLVEKVNMEKQEIDDSRFIVDDSVYANSKRNMRLHIEEIYDINLLKYNDLVNYGLSNVQGPSKVNVELEKRIKELTNDENLRFINNKIKDFENKKNAYLKRFEELNKIRQKFVDDYSISKLLKLPVRDYVVGFQERTFSYRLEEELKDLGDIHGQPSDKFGLWFGTKGNDDEKKYRWESKFGDTVEEAYQNIISEIVELIDAGSKEDRDRIKDCRLHAFLRGKILATYFPDKYLPIFSNDHLNHFLDKTVKEYDIRLHIFDRKSILIDWKNNNPIMRNWTIQLFTEFLYQTFGKPVKDVEKDINKKVSDNQEKRDEEYPKEYVRKAKLNQKEWKELLINKNVFRESDIEFLKRIYKKDNHAATPKELSIEDGVAAQKYNWPVVKLAKRILNEKGLTPNKDEQGEKEYWSILFWGSYTEDNYFEWKIQPKLVKAMEIVFPEIVNTYNDEEEEREDSTLVGDVAKANLDSNTKFEYDNRKYEKEKPVYQNGHKTYPRDRKKAMNALAHAGYVCEIDASHKTFERKKSGQQYTEPHHLVPISRSGEFEVCLDREQNIVSLCSNCHNQIHYGKGAEELLKQLYEQRKELLEEVGIKISLEELLEMYK